MYCNGAIDEKYINLIYGLNYCPTSGANMLWLPNQSPTPDEMENHLTHNCHSSIKHCRSLNLVSSTRDQDLPGDLYCYFHHPNFTINDLVNHEPSSSNSSCVESIGSSSRESCTQSQNDSLDES